MRARLALLAVVMATLAGCGRDARPNVVLITLDTTRADRLGTMGWSAARTPVLDALAARGVVYERAYAQVPLTLPSHATMLTGLDPSRHRVHDNGRFALPPEVPTVAERLQAAGYDTAAFVAAFVLDSSFGLDRGFSSYDDDVPVLRDPMRHDVPRRPGAQVTDRALAWLGTHHTAPVFMWVHYYDVHAPRRPPPPFDTMPDAYDGALASVDAEVGRLLDGVTRAAGGRPALVLVVGDHGESLGEHDEETHGFLVYDATLHVPLVVAGPGFPAGGRARRFVGTDDVAPTILAAAGLPTLPGGRGRPLSARLAADDAVEPFECLGGTYRLGWARLGGVRTARWKLTAEPEPVELYDTIADPGETLNRAASEPAVVADLMARWTAAGPAADEPAPSASPARAPAQIEEQLAALGYVDVAPASRAAAPPDPRRYVASLRLVELAQTRAAEGAVGPAIAALEALATSLVVRPLALSALAQIELANDRPSDAVHTAAALVELTDSFDAKLTLARARLDTGDAAGALALLDAAATAGGISRRARQLRVLVLLELGRTDDAVAEAERVLAMEPADPGAIALAARARSVRDGPAAEIPRLEAILSSTGVEQGTEIRLMLAALLRQEGRDVDAARVLGAVAAPPVEVRVMLAAIASDHGNPTKAASLLESVAKEQPGVLRHRRRLADLYGTLDRPADALAQYDALVVANPRDATLLVDRGVTKAALGERGEAEADYRQALALDDRVAEAHLNLALVELADGRDDDAESHLLRAVELRPDYRKAHFHLARLYARRHDPRGRRHAELAAGTTEPGAPEGSPERH